MSSKDNADLTLKELLYNVAYFSRCEKLIIFMLLACLVYDDNAYKQQRGLKILITILN